MPIYNLYIFGKNGSCHYYAEWNRKKHLEMDKDQVTLHSVTLATGLVKTVEGAIIHHLGF